MKALLIVVAILNLTRAFSAPVFSLLLFRGLKKGESRVAFIDSLHGRFLSVRTASTVTHMTITIITAAIPNSTVPVDARPVTGADVGAGVGAAALSVK